MAASSGRLGSFLKQLPLWWQNQLAAMRALDELHRSPHAEVLRTASDFGATVQRLKSAAARGPLSGQLMEKMARAYGLEPAALRRTDPNSVREMEERCTFFASRFRCAIDLADADGASRAQAYCDNTEMFRTVARR
jgi:hypothetical protein